MKLVTLAAMAVLAGTNLSARDAKAFAHTVQICVDAVTGTELRTFSEGEAITTRMFAGIGIKVEWVDARHCPVGAILVRLSVGAPNTERPGTLAYALPYGGSYIKIYYDRIAHAIDARAVPVLLAHVMAHEITHILEGVSRHSEEGLMKASWTREDDTQMAWKPLPFAQEDVDLIYCGLEKREEIALR